MDGDVINEFFFLYKTKEAFIRQRPPSFLNVILG